MGATKPDWMKGLPILGLIWLTGAVVDRAWFAIDRSVPSWDQADYLTGAMNYWQVLQSPQWFSQSWWTEFWMMSSKIPPLVYISTVPFLAIFGAGVEQSTIVNLFYGAILLGAVYGLGARLFDVQVALWAAALCLLFPKLYGIRLEFLLDYPLVAMVTLSFFTLTMWAVSAGESSSRSQNHLSFHGLTLPSVGYSWLWSIAFGIAFGLSLLTKQTALLFLAAPIAGLGIRSLWQKAWIKLAQLLLSLAVTLTVCLPWYRLNWLLILTASKRATIDSAIIEGDPPLNTLDAWVFYLKLLPSLVSYPLLLVGTVGLLLYWKRSVILGEWFVLGGRLRQKIDYGGLRKRGYRQAIYRRWWRSLGWLAVFLVGGYLLSSLNVNKDDRYITPLLPVLAVVLAQGLVLFPDRLRGLRWGAVGLSTLMMIFNLMPIESVPSFLSTTSSDHAAPAVDWHHEAVIDEVIRTDPYLRTTLGVLPSLPSLNQHNLNYFGVLRNFQVYGRQVGTQLKQVEQDARSLPWFVAKSGDQGSIRQPLVQTALQKTIFKNPDLQLKKTWSLPDQSTLYLYRRQVPVLQVQPLGAKSQGQPIRLEQVRVPNQAAPGQPLPITYRWSGDWKQLRSGLVLLTWSRTDQTKVANRWLHDHAIALGMLQPNAGEDDAQFQVVERLTMLPPANAAGSYALTATYLNSATGETYRIPVPDVQLEIDPEAIVVADAPVDLVTKLRSLSALIPKGIKALPGVFEQISSINQYDPTQNYAVQARQTLTYRLQQEPENLEFAYNLALAAVLTRQVDRAITAFERVTQLDSKNPYAYAYLAFVNLYDFRPKAAQTALRSALSLNPKLPELHALNGVAALMQGNLVQAWREAKTFERG